MVASYAVAPSVENILASRREIFLKIGVEDKKISVFKPLGNAFN